VIVRPFPNVAGGRWDVATAQAKWPLWGRDGRELFYVTDRGIVSVAIDTSQGSFRWASPQIVVPKLYSNFTGPTGPRNCDISADGKRFLVIKDADTGGRNGAFVIVQNWFDELRATDHAR
jgi:Tol biopolymer transport system component